MGSKDLLDKRVSISLRFPKSVRDNLKFFCDNRPYSISMYEAVDRSLTFFLGAIDYSNLSSIELPDLSLSRSADSVLCSYTLSTRNVIVLTALSKQIGVPRNRLALMAISNLLNGKYPDLKS